MITVVGRSAPRAFARAALGCLAPILTWGAALADRAVVQAAELTVKVPIREVRVLLASAAERVRVSSGATIDLRADGEPALTSVASDEPLIIELDGGGAIRWGAGRVARNELRLSARGGGTLDLSFDRGGEWSQPIAYPGSLRARRGDAGGVEVVNEVDLERYVGCVVAGEVWPTFHTEALRGQAIVTRTFVLYHMTRRPDAAVDVSATQGSQVYRGIRDDPLSAKSREAAEYTRGLVLTYDDNGTQRIFCAYFSAACGGSSQPAKLLGAEGDVEPLRGGVKCDFCKDAPGDTYRWGPVSMTLDDLLARLVERYPDLADLGRIKDIAPIERTANGRPVSLRITGTTGRSEDILAERFRLAVGANLVKSTDCRVRVVGDEAIFDQGKGFGHGLGLCQWGMEGQARAGKHAAEILRYYYPGSTLTRVY